MATDLRFSLDSAKTCSISIRSLILRCCIREMKKTTVDSQKASSGRAFRFELLLGLIVCVNWLIGIDPILMAWLYASGF